MPILPNHYATTILVIPTLDHRLLAIQRSQEVYKSFAKQLHETVGQNHHKAELIKPKKKADTKTFYRGILSYYEQQIW